MRGGTKGDAKEVTKQRERLTQQEREIAQLRAQLDKMQVGSELLKSMTHAGKWALLRVVWAEGSQTRTSDLTAES